MAVTQLPKATVTKTQEQVETRVATGEAAAAFLAGQPRPPVAAIARAAANIIDTRRDRLFALAERLER